MSKYIDADALIEELQHCSYETWSKDINRAWWAQAVKVKDNIVKCIKQQPTADVVEVRHGEWLPTNIPTMFSGVIHECSICKAKDGEHSSILGYYCWRCGAKMDGERREE